VDCIAKTLKKGGKVCEVTREAEEAWTKEIVDNSAERASFRSECTPGM
jgi:hypothetical protein